MSGKNICSLLEEGKVKDAKSLIRSSLGEPERYSVWKKILEVRSEDSFCCSSLYWDTVDTCYGSRSLSLESGRLPGFVDPHHVPQYGLSAEGGAKVCRVLTVLAYNSPDISHIPLLYPVTSLLTLSGLQEEEVYSFLSLLISPPSSLKINYLTQTRSGWDVLCFSLRPLAVKYVKGSVAFIEKEFSSDSEEFFLSWPWWIFDHLSTSVLLRLMDCYFYEGHKVLFRAALALLKLFFKSINTNTDTFQAAKSSGLASAFAKYVKNLSMSADQFLTVAFKFPRFSKADIAKLSAKLEMEAKANRLTRTGRRHRSSENVGEAGGGVGLSFSTPQHRPSGTYPIHQLASELLSKDQLVSIWDELPERIISVRPTLAYSSNEHGVSLTTFFNRVDKYEPTILVVRTSEREVFGAYCSTSWAQRNQKDDKGLRMRYFGTGESFLFKFKGSMLTKYEWVKKDLSDDEEGESPKKKEREKELFMSADNTMVTVGGGNGLAIYLDENLRYGQTERCDTFNNEPLCSSRDFTINSIEVFGFVDISW